MTLGLNRRTHYGSTGSRVNVLAGNFEKRRAWASCPRCIGGNMYQEAKGEYKCIQCGCSIFPGKVKDIYIGQR